MYQCSECAEKFTGRYCPKCGMRNPSHAAPTGDLPLRRFEHVELSTAQKIEKMERRAHELRRQILDAQDELIRVEQEAHDLRQWGE